MARGLLFPLRGLNYPVVRETERKKARRHHPHERHMPVLSHRPIHSLCAWQTQVAQRRRRELAYLHSPRHAAQRQGDFVGLVSRHHAAQVIWLKISKKKFSKKIKKKNFFFLSHLFFYLIIIWLLFKWMDEGDCEHSSATTATALTAAPTGC